MHYCSVGLKMVLKHVGNLHGFQGQGCQGFVEPREKCPQGPIQCIIIYCPLF